MKVRRPPPAALALALLALVPAGIGRAQQPAPSPQYRVELIVFRAVTALGAPENWAARTTHQSLEGEAPASAGSTEVGRLVRMLGPGELQLREIAKRLQASGTYEPVAHVGWMQTASSWGARVGLPVDRVGIRVPGLTGTVFLERGQFLHLGMTLDYAMEPPPDGIGAGFGTVFSLDQMRRIRFYERNYYDHPAFGVIALVTPAQGARRTGR